MLSNCAFLDVVIEQPPQEKYRIKYNDKTKLFSRTSVPSYYYLRKFSWWYGWISGTGPPPNSHCDAILISEKNWDIGDIVTGYLIGVFTKKHDYKYLIIEVEQAIKKNVFDLHDLPAIVLNELFRLYTHPLPEEKWLGKSIARKELFK